MKISEFSDEIASACGTRAKAVIAVQKETFRLLRAALDKGERVQIPEFGIFSMKDVAGKEGEPDKKVVRFKTRDGKAGKEGRSRKDGRVKDPAKGRKKAAKSETVAGEKEQSIADVANASDK
jgi:nucleoid DNA-binding protein